jgi:hypothetical protein
MVNPKNAFKNNNYLRRVAALNKDFKYSHSNSFESDIESESKIILRIGKSKRWGS